MCLTLDLKATKAWKRKHRGQKFVWRWKVFIGRPSSLLTTVFKEEIKNPGRIRSNRRLSGLTQREKEVQVVNLGCHFFVFCTEANKFATRYKEIPLRVRCNVCDYVASGRFESFGAGEVFMGYEILNSEWERVFKELPK